MTTPIDRGREKLAKAKAKLPKKGILADWTLTLRKYPADTGLSFDPASHTAGTPATLVVEAPDVQPVSLAAVGLAGGLLMAGDVKVKLPRTAALEAFIGKPPYPDMPRVQFVMNGAIWQPVAAKAGLLQTVFTCRKLAKEV